MTEGWNGGALRGLPAGCPADRMLRLMWGEWTTHILWALGDVGPQRFVRLRGHIEGVSPKVLSARLKRMEQDGLLWRSYETTMPPTVTYGLTERGEALHRALKALEPVAEAWFGEDPPPAE